MVIKMMKWRPWPPLVSRKYEVTLIVRTLEGCDLLRDSPEKVADGVRELTVEIRRKGPKLTLSSLRRTTVIRNFTREVVDEAVAPVAVVVWDEDFRSLCNLSAYKDNVFHPWEIAFTVFNGLNQKPKIKASVIGARILFFSLSFLSLFLRVIPVIFFYINFTADPTVLY